MVLQMQMTVEEFLRFAEDHPDKRFDFMDGELVEVSPKPLHGRIQTILATALENYTRQHLEVGVVYTEVLHVLDGEKFIPDVCVNRARAADYLTTPPLLAAEIRSDSQSRESQRRKARAYLAHGTRLVLLVLPGERLEVFRPDQALLVLGMNDVFDGGAELPGFRLAARDLLEALA